MKLRFPTKDEWLIIGEALTTVVALGLMIASFIVPPTGVIDPSVLQGVGEILVFPVIWMVPQAIRAGRRIKYKDLEIGGSEDKDEN